MSELSERLDELQDRLAHEIDLVAQIKQNAKDETAKHNARIADLQARVDQIKAFLAWQATQ